MSSLALVDTFFPATASLLPHAVRDALSPAWASAACPAPSLALPPLPRRLGGSSGGAAAAASWPSLLAVTLAGAPLALALASRLERRAAAARTAPAVAEELRLWRAACVLFAGMNAAAALAHCVLPPATGGDPLAWPLRLARAADVACTGAASTFLIAASAARRAARRGRENGGAGADGARPRRLLATGAALAVAAVAFAGNAVPAGVAARAAAAAAAAAPSSASSWPRRAALAALARGQLPLANEAAYLAPTLLAAALLALSDVPRAPRRVLAALLAPVVGGGGARSRRARTDTWALGAAAAAALALASLALDAPACRLLGPRGFAAGANGVTALFVACDLAFVALTGYALAAAEEGREGHEEGGKAARRLRGPVRVTAVATAALALPATPAAAAKARRREKAR